MSPRPASDLGKKASGSRCLCRRPAAGGAGGAGDGWWYGVVAGGHLGVAVEVGAFLNNQRPSVDLAGDVASRTNLDPAVTINLAVNVAGDGDLGSGQACGYVRFFFDNDRALALDLALDRPEQSYRTLGFERAFEAGVLADQTLDVGAVDHRAAQTRRRQAYID